MKRAPCVVGLLVAVLTSSPAFAGIADSPLPELLAGEKTYHLYSVPGIIANSAGLATFFSCTSTDTATMQVGIEIFLSDGTLANDAVASSLSVTPGQTRRFGTAPAAGIVIESNLGAGASRASARILATSKKLACTAFVADTVNVPPVTAFQVTIIKATKQNGN